MKNSPKQIDRQTLKTLEPLNRLNPILLDELATKSIVEEIPAGKIICRHGEKDSRQIYLLSGKIEVATEGETKTKIIKSKSALKTPIAIGSPRTVTLKTKINSTLLYIDSDLLELLMSDEPELNFAYEVSEINNDDSDDWMLTFLQSPAFLQLPTQNIQKLLTHLVEIPVKKGQVVIQQDGKDDNYYIIKSGSCNVHRKPHHDASNVLLAVLPAGSGFGEEALISNGSRNATITMREDGTLMQLKKDDFLSLLITPLIQYFELSDTQKKLDEGCVFIDVRTEQQSQEKPLEGSVNIPLSMLRVKFDSLNADREYLLVCNDGSQSAAAAFLMIQSGLKCSVLKDGLNSAPRKKEHKATSSPATTSTSSKVKQQQAEAAKIQTQKIAAQQKEIIAAREKAEQDIIKHKKDLEESRTRISQKNQHASSLKVEADKLREKASLELAKAQAERDAIELRQKETNIAMMRAEEMMKNSATAAEETRKQAEKEAALIKQRALEEAESLRAEKAAQDLANAEAEKEAFELRQKETNLANLQAEETRKQAEKEAALIKQRALEEIEILRAEKAAQEIANTEAKKEAILIKQQALEEAEYLRAEVKAAHLKMEEDAARLKEEELIVKNSALKIKNEADEIRREALRDAQQVRSEIEATRSLLEEKLQQTKDEEKRKHEAILSKAKIHADKLAASKTQEAVAEANAIRQKAEEDAAHLHNELEETRKQIEAEATRVINDLKAESEKVAASQKVKNVQEEAAVELVDENKYLDDFKTVSVPGMFDVAPIDNNEALRKAEIIKEKLTQSQINRVSQQDGNSTVYSATDVKVHKSNDKTILEGEDDLFIFEEPEMPTKETTINTPAPIVSHRTKAESDLTQISVEPRKSVVIFPQQEQGSSFKNNPFLNEDNLQTPKANHTQQFNKQLHMNKHTNTKSNTMAIAASFFMILAGAIFTLHATNTLKVQSIAALFNSGNDSVQSTAIAKTIGKKVLRAKTNVDVKKKVDNKVDDIMQGWKNILSESKTPKKIEK